MIQAFLDKYMSGKEMLEAGFKAQRPDSYEAIVKAVVNLLTGDDYADDYLDPDRITRIDHGDYQGTEVYVIAATGYQPSTYWYVKVSYGSCSGCDTLRAVREYSDYDAETPSKKELDGYLTLALHIVQGLKKMGDEE